VWGTGSPSKQTPRRVLTDKIGKKGDPAEKCNPQSPQEDTAEGGLPEEESKTKQGGKRKGRFTPQHEPSF